MNAATANTAVVAATPSLTDDAKPSLSIEDSRKDATKEEETDQDEEVCLAMEMALAAAQNPHLSADALRKLVGKKNKQVQIVEQEKLKKQEQQKQEAQKRWNDKKEMAFRWWSNKAAVVAQKAEEIKFEAEKQYYAEDIKKDQTMVEIRKKMKVCKKTVKAHRLQGNRVETRHAFKRQRMEKRLLEVNKKLKKSQHLLTHTSYNVQEYAKAMMKASRKWKKKGTKAEISLEAQLCRNMHQMLAIEKQKAKLKKSTRELKKYLQRCKSWLSDKKAFCELHMMTLDATQSSMKLLYEDILNQQDAVIRKLKESEEFKGVDLESVDDPILHSLDQAPGPTEMLNALRGLPIRDSIRLKKENVEKAVAVPNKQQTTGRPELVIEANDDCSVSSNLTDPDGDVAQQEEKGVDDMGDSDSQVGFGFDSDAPWMSKQSISDSMSDDLSIDGEEEVDAKPVAKKNPPQTEKGTDTKPAAKKDPPKESPPPKATPALESGDSNKETTEVEDKTAKSPEAAAKQDNDSGEPDVEAATNGEVATDGEAITDGEADTGGEDITDREADTGGEAATDGEAAPGEAAVVAPSDSFEEPPAVETNKDPNPFQESHESILAGAEIAELASEHSTSENNKPDVKFAYSADSLAYFSDTDDE